MNLNEKKENISKSFYKRYFEQNAINRIADELLKFLWFKEGHFIHPAKKDAYIKKYTEEEIDNFYNKNLLIMPQLEFCITTKCTLKCKDCCAFIPQIDKIKRSEMSFKEFKLYLDKILKNIDGIRRFVILGGETLINPQLPEMLEYASEQEKIFNIEVVTNATILPNIKLIKILRKYNNKLYIYISNYSDIEELAAIQKINEFENILKENNIKYQKLKNNLWYTEKGFTVNPADEEIARENFYNCYRTKCNQVINGFFYICSKASARTILMGGGIEDGIDIINTKNLRNELIEFYKAPYIDACRYCIPYTETVKPAIQM